MNNDSGPVPDRSLRAQNDPLGSILRTLDAIIFLQIGIAYLSDNLTFLLVLRAVSQVVHVQYRPPGTNLQLTPVLFVNVICYISHLLSDRSGTKYIHGGLIIDFVGELPSSRWKLLLQDSILAALQLLMVVVGYQKQLLSGETQLQADAPQQDLEAEEEGRRRSRDQEPQAETEQGGSEEAHSAPTKSGEMSDPDDDLVVLDIRKGLKALLRRPIPTTSPTVEDPTVRAGLANVLARVAAARARAT
ncbi:hypothetical protein LTS15_000701 [Exophiala xenobiotica]|nr:hypothetical protein LTS15_000701 [Exophiala xenobiotica]